MTINWKVRLRNPVFWRNIIVGIMAVILAQLGTEWSQITSWAKLFNLLWQAVNNPVIVVASLAVIFNALNDPTTAGNSDSVQAMGYVVPRESK